MIRFFILLFFILLYGCASQKKETKEELSQQMQNAEINLQLGMAYLLRQDIPRAKQKLLIASEEAPQLPEVWYSLAYFNEVTGNKSIANEYYLKAIKLAPYRGDTHNNYGTYLCRQGHYKEAIIQFNLAFEDPDYLNAGSAYENAGLCALKIPDKKQAKEYLLLAKEKDPKRFKSYRQLERLNENGN